MKSSSCTQPFTKYICPVLKHKKNIKLFSVCSREVLKIVVLRKMTLKLKKMLLVKTRTVISLANSRSRTIGNRMNSVELYRQRYSWQVDTSPVNRHVH